MIYITKVELENFQSHSHSVMEFDRGLNVILGNSDSGKTAVLRGIKWTLYNEPLGDYFIRQGETNVSVTITFNTGTVVKRLRTRSKNAYYLKKPDGKEYNFEGFGTVVPKEISETIGMYKINLDNENRSILNIAEQLEGPFLLNEKPSLRASAIGRLIGVNYVDDALRNVVRDNKRIQQDLKILKSNQKSLQEKIAEFDYLKDLENKYKELVTIRESIGKNQALLEKYHDFLNRFLNYQKEIDNLKTRLKYYQNIDTLEKKVLRLDNLSSRHHYMSLLYDKLKDNQKDFYDTKIQYNQVQNIGQIDLLLETIQEKSMEFSKKEVYFQQLNYQKTEIHKTKVSLKRLKNLNRWEEIYQQLYISLIQFKKQSKFLKELEKIEGLLSIGREYTKEFEDLNEGFKIINELTTKIIYFRSLTSKQEQFINVSIQLNRLEKELKKHTIKIIHLSKEYEDFIMELKICPFCYSEITESSLAHIKSHLRGDNK
ncbi:MAG: AAA family ATPase [Tissierellia bacterium]|nr:AAA family ATPase [Tissierellia bacterium]